MGLGFTSGAAQGDDVSLCHATGSASNPYELITVNAAGAYNGHLGIGPGQEHQGSEDIIPPFTFDGQQYSQNWDAEGQAIFEAGCVVTQQPEPSATTPPDGDENVTLCHATHSATNPFVVITVDAAGAFNGHLGTGNGDHQDGEDIIPPFTFEGQVYSQNWDAEGQAIFEAGCVFAQVQPTATMVPGQPTVTTVPGQPTATTVPGQPAPTQAVVNALPVTGAHATQSTTVPWMLAAVMAVALLMAAGAIVFRSTRH
jgi:hypothetical protein